VAGDGAEALEMIRDIHPDLVVLDLLMPRVSGFEVLREMERDERLKAIPVVAVSSVIKENISDFVRLRGAEGFIERGDLRKGLVQKTKQILDSEATA